MDSTAELVLCRTHRRYDQAVRTLFTTADATELQRAMFLIRRLDCKTARGCKLTSAPEPSGPPREGSRCGLLTVVAIAISGEGPTRCQSYSLHDNDACIAADTIGAAATDMSLPSRQTPGTSITAPAQLVCITAAVACPDWT
jgi:hypothetical protein